MSARDTADFGFETAGDRPATDLPTRLLRVVSAAALATSGYIHGQLYLDGYRFIHVVGVLFLLQAAASFALAALLLIGAIVRPPVLVDLAAAATALGALGGFAASRTVGVFGFTEHGLQPAPQALISVLVEVAAIALLAAAAIRTLRRSTAPSRRRQWETSWALALKATRSTADSE